MLKEQLVYFNNLWMGKEKLLLVINFFLSESEYLFHKIGLSTRAEWRNPQVESIMKLALEVKQHVKRLTPLNCSNWEMAVVVSAPSDLWKQLQVSKQ